MNWVARYIGIWLFAVLLSLLAYGCVTERF